jgi:hypothetical protein
MREDDYKHLYQRFKEEEEKRSERDRTIKELNQKLSSLERKNDMLNANMIDFAKKATDKVTTIYNGNVSNVQSNTLQLQHFDPSQFRDKIKPPFRMIYSVPQLVDHLHKFGFGNVYRSCDRSRNAVVWIDNEGTEVRDSNCSQLREHALKAMEGDLRSQLVYQKEREAHLEKMEGTDHLNELIRVRTNISFCHQLLNRDTKLMKDVQKELSKRAKNKKDTTIDVPKIVGYTNFLSLLDTTLFPNILDWITLSITDLGTWLGRQLHNDVHVEGGSFSEESPFILIKNDEGNVKIVDAIEFHNYVKTAYNQTMTYQCQTIVDHLLTHISSLNTSNVENLIRWIESPSKEESCLLLRSFIQTYR